MLDVQYPLCDKTIMHISILLLLDICFQTMCQSWDSSHSVSFLGSGHSWVTRGKLTFPHLLGCGGLPVTREVRLRQECKLMLSQGPLDR